jgi:protein-disulfide isomerase
MANEIPNSKRSNSLRPLIPWRARAKYRVGKTVKQRRAQYEQQTTVLKMVLFLTIVIGALVILLNWRNAGATKTVSCTTYPQYCVPLAGGSPDQEDLEAAGTRSLDEESRGAEGVVRYVDAENIVTIGNPNAPIHFRVVSDFACGHCNDYHDSDLRRFIEDFVITGQATFGLVMTTGTGRSFSETASQAALCAGEQGAFWEMNDELFRLARAEGARSFNLSRLRKSASDMGLNAEKLVTCVSSDRYRVFLPAYSTFANDLGVTATPTLLVSYGDGGEWTRLEHTYRGYDSMKSMTEQANASAPPQSRLWRYK